MMPECGIKLFQMVRAIRNLMLTLGWEIHRRLLLHNSPVGWQVGLVEMFCQPSVLSPTRLFGTVLVARRFREEIFICFPAPA